MYELQSKTLSDTDDPVMKTLANMSIAYQNLGELDEARRINEELLNKQLQMREISRIDIILTMDRLAKNCFYMEDYKRADDLWLDAVRELKATLGTDNINTVNVREHYYELTAFIQKRFAYSADMLYEVHEDMCRLLGEEHPRTLITKAKYNIVSAMDNHNEWYAFSGASDLFDKLSAVLGEDHPDIWKFRYYMGLATSWISTENGLSVLESVYNAQKRIYGEYHPETRMVMRSIEKIRKEKEEWDRKQRGEGVADQE